MARHILNISRNCFLKRRQAERAIEACACTWVDYGRTIRDLTLREAIDARMLQADRREPLALAELKNVVFRFRDRAALKRERQLARDADKFCAQG